MSRAVFVVCLFVVCFVCLFYLFAAAANCTALHQQNIAECSLARHSEQCYFIIGGRCHKRNFCRDKHGVVATKRQNTALQRQKLCLWHLPPMILFFFSFLFCSSSARLCSDKILQLHDWPVTVSIAASLENITQSGRHSESAGMSRWSRSSR